MVRARPSVDHPFSTPLTNELPELRACARQHQQAEPIPRSRGCGSLTTPPRILRLATRNLFLDADQDLRGRAGWE
jgi:hypothetical protein